MRRSGCKSGNCCSELYYTGEQVGKTFVHNFSDSLRFPPTDSLFCVVPSWGYSSYWVEKHTSPTRQRGSSM